jgi:hypothetical protein
MEREDFDKQYEIKQEHVFHRGISPEAKIHKGISVREIYYNLRSEDGKRFRVRISFSKGRSVHGKGSDTVWNDRLFLAYKDAEQDAKQAKERAGISPD